VKETKYGFISDIHGNPKIVDIALERLLARGAQRIILNGDLGDSQEELQRSQGLVLYAIKRALETNLPVYAQPGSHESLLVYDPVVKFLKGKHNNLFDAIENKKVEFEDHDLVFIPGSDFVSGGQYMFGGKMQTGFYADDERVEDVGEAIGAAITDNSTPLHYQNVNDLRELVTRPDRTILVCHVPRKFSNIETCVDMADFVQQGRSVMPAEMVREDLRKEYGQGMTQEQMDVIAADNNFRFRVENRGNVDLARVYEEAGVKKAVNGHFHESSHRANDRESKHVREGEYVDELFWNSGFVSGGYTGILTIREDGRVKYENIDLRKAA
jgi:hypothetical protein